MFGLMELGIPRRMLEAFRFYWEGWRLTSPTGHFRVFFRYVWNLGVRADESSSHSTLCCTSKVKVPTPMNHVHLLPYLGVDCQMLRWGALCLPL